jgi:hypothetical protein
LIAGQLRQQAREQRNQTRKKRRLAKGPVLLEAPKVSLAEKTCEPPQEKPAPPPEKPIKSGSKKPAANHPWRRSPIGRALYRPSKNSRN